MSAMRNITRSTGVFSHVACTVFAQRPHTPTVIGCYSVFIIVTRQALIYVVKHMERITVSVAMQQNIALFTGRVLHHRSNAGL